MSLARVLLRNIASNWIGYFVQIVVAFALTPFILSSLGQTRYGIWTLAIGLTGYYGLLDLGFTAGITQYLTRYLAVKDMDRVNRTASTGFVALTSCGFFIFVVALVIAANASHLFRIPQDSANEAATVIAITAASLAIQFAFFSYSAVFTAVQRFDLSNAIGIATRILSAAAAVLALKFGYGLVGLSIATAGTNVTDYVIRWQVAKRLLPGLKVSIGLASRTNFHELMAFGIWNFLIAGSVRLISYTDSLVIAAFMPLAAVAPFAVAASMRTYFEDIFTRAGYVFFPAATQLDSQGDLNGLRRLYLVSSRFMLLGSVFCGSLAMYWAKPFFRFWIGASYAEPTGYPTVALLFYLLQAGTMIGVAQRVGYQVLQAVRQLRLLAVLFTFEGISNLLMSVILVRPYGLIGVAVGTLIPAVVFQGVFQPFFVCRSLQISLNTYSRQVLMRPALAILALCPLLMTSFVFDLTGPFTNLFPWMIISGAVAAGVVAAVGLDKSERTYMSRPIGIVLAKFKAALSNA